MAISIRLNPEIEQRLEHLAVQTGRPKSYYLRELIEGGLDDLEDFYLAGATIEQALAKQPEAVVSVRGKDLYVIIDMAQYQHLRECELEVALAEARADVAAGQVVHESAEAHLGRLDALA